MGIIGSGRLADKLIVRQCSARGLERCRRNQRTRARSLARVTLVLLSRSRFLLDGPPPCRCCLDRRQRESLARIADSASSRLSLTGGLPFFRLADGGRALLGDLRAVLRLREHFDLSRRTCCRPRPARCGHRRLPAARAGLAPTDPCPAPYPASFLPGLASWRHRT